MSKILSGLLINEGVSKMVIRVFEEVFKIGVELLYVRLQKLVHILWGSEATLIGPGRVAQLVGASASTPEVCRAVSRQGTNERQGISVSLSLSPSLSPHFPLSLLFSHFLLLQNK